MKSGSNPLPDPVKNKFASDKCNQISTGKVEEEVPLLEQSDDWVLRLILPIMKMGSERRAIPSTHSYDRNAAAWNHVLGKAEISDVVGTYLIVGREPYRVIH